MENICSNSCNAAEIDMLFGTTDLEVKVVFAENPKLICFFALFYTPFTSNALIGNFSLICTCYYVLRRVGTEEVYLFI